MTLDGFPYHGVLAHQNNSSSSQGNTDVLHLLRTDAVGSDDKALWVLIEQLLENGE
jgi:hypothetical protein